MILVLKATQPVAETVIICATATGSKLTIPVPTPTVAGLKVVLVSLQLSVPVRGSGRTVPDHRRPMHGPQLHRQVTFHARRWQHDGPAEHLAGQLRREPTVVRRRR
jgi:hypothetical protein